MAQRLLTPPLPTWVGDLPVYERRLANGLKALVLPRRQAPVVVCDLYYPAGSVDDPPGQTGLAHFVEHMLFKGTHRLPKGHLDRLAFLAAGQINAETSEDLTHYWFALPRERWELALAVEGDRMRGALFDPREIEAERHVIAEERALEFDSPLARLDQQHMALSYLVHPYRNPILGWPEDARGLGSAELTSFYETHYRPDGAVLVIVGDLEPELALDRIAHHFEMIAAAAAPRPGPPPSEPRQKTRRSFVLDEVDGISRGIMGWHTVPMVHPDTPALDVLADILSCGKRSRLWARLVERDHLVTWVDASQESSHLAGQFVIQIEANLDADAHRLEAVVIEELARLTRDGPTAHELARSRNRLEAAWRWEQEDPAGLAAGLGQFALWGDWHIWQDSHRACLAVTGEDIQRVAARYLEPSGLTIGWLAPRRVGRASLGREAIPEALELPRTDAPPIEGIALDWLVPMGTATLADYRPQRTTLTNGARLIFEPRPGTGTIALELYVDSGLLREAKPGLAHLAGRLREEGTHDRSAEELAAAIEDVGGMLDVSATGVSVRARAEDLELAVDLIADLTLCPAFPAEALDWLVKRIDAEYQADLEDPAFRADAIFRQLVYGAHPLGRDPRGTPRDYRRIRIADIHEHHRRHFHPDRAFLVCVGDFDPRRLEALLERAFAGWKPSGTRAPSLPSVIDRGRGRVRRVYRPGAQVHVVLGHMGIPRHSPDFEALAVLDHIFGSGPGFTDRLSRVLRDELGLAYSVGGGFTDSADLLPGVFRVSVGTAPSETVRVVSIIRDEIAAMCRGEFSSEDVDRARRYLASSWVFDYQTVSQRADRLLELERWNLPPDDPLRWPDRIMNVTHAQVHQAARKHLRPEALVRVELGPISR